MTVKKKKTKKVGKPHKIGSNKKLLELYLEYKSEKGHYYRTNENGNAIKHYNLLSIVGFTNFLGRKIDVQGNKYWYGLGDEYSHTKKEIENDLEEHWMIGTANGDIRTAFGIFYGKNKFGYADKIETINTNLDYDAVELSDKELEKIINDKKK